MEEFDGLPGLKSTVSERTPQVAPSPTKPSEILSAAADLLDRPGAWTQGEFARDIKGSGFAMWGDDPRAVCWCARGAIQAAMQSHRFEAELAVLEHLKAVLPVKNVSVWNDKPSRTRSEVVGVFRQAAEKAREAGA